jgi:hypothetical protein
MHVGSKLKISRYIAAVLIFKMYNLIKKQWVTWRRKIDIDKYLGRSLSLSMWKQKMGRILRKWG